MNGQCKKCGALCCRYFCFEIDEPDSYEEFDDIRWYLCHEGISVHIDEGDWYISIANRCKMLNSKNECTIYEDRPIICRKYEPDSCDFTGGNYDYDEEFTSPEQIDAYAKKVLGKKTYKRQKTKARAKVEKKNKKNLKKNKDSKSNKRK